MNAPFDIQIHELQLRDPFGLSRGTRRLVRNLFIRIGDGWGEGAPIYYRGQDVDRMAFLAREWFDSAPDMERHSARILDEIHERYPGETGLWQAVNLALIDRWVKNSGKSLQELWDIPWRDNLVSSFTIGMDDMDTVMRKVEQAAPYPILKIKVGGESDLEILRAIHQRTQKPLYVDANEGWTLAQAKQYLPVMKECGVRVIEQPLPGDNLEGYIRLRMANQTGIPILVDESVHAPEDVATWVGLADGINVKLAKCGGLSQARRAIALARENGLLVMLGCMIESSLGVTAAAQLAPLVDFIDLDGAALLANDPFEGLALDKGCLRLRDLPGIGAVPINNCQ